MNEATEKPRIALWFRYGPAEHTELFHAIPDIVEYLSAQAEVHYFGLNSAKPLPETIRQHAVVHHLPFTVDRTRMRDKFIKTALWVLCLPWIGLKCRLMGVRAVYIDETVPLTALLARFFYGPRIAFTVADFFTDIYFQKKGLSQCVGRLIRAIDTQSWKRVPVFFTRAKSTRAYLATLGIPEEHIHPVYDPCDFSIYHPVAPAQRAAARAALGIAPGQTVLVHHGILHPNKGNDRILRALADIKEDQPGLRYLLVGDGPDMPRLKQLTNELRMQDRVIFTGWLPTLNDVNNALNAGDIGLVMRTGQRSDDFHMTGALVHSMAVGLPVISARLAGVAEVIHDNENGFLFAPDDMADFTAKLKQLIDDPDLRRRFGEKTRALAHEIFDMQHVVRATCTPLLQLAGMQ
ncbi:MAG: glycosyltransferase family 1 protein [Spartobacteria bacterium]|nr:glycosyltransferase family 1 protein [Spartobacteria bacterium]